MRGEDKVSRIIKLYRSAARSVKIMVLSGTAIILFIVFLVIFGDYMTPYNPYDFSTDVFSPPTWNHLMGTDSLGRDLLSRVIHGARWSIGISLIATSISLSSGTFLGAVAGYVGRYVDRMLTFIMDALWVFPTLLLCLLISVVLGPGIVNTSLAISIAAIPGFYRIIRSQTLAIRERGFIEAERMINASSLYIIRRHITPFYTSTLSVLGSMRMARAILSVASLGFLGLGIPPPTPEWGTLLALGRDQMIRGKWWLTVFPGLMVFIAIMGFNLLSEGLDVMLKPVTGKMR